MSWIYTEPINEGWYATLYCWDPQEGTFPGPNYWDGRTWQEKLPVIAHSPVPFSSIEEAKSWGRTHDPEQ
jgi:hypothetical protein